MTLINIFQIYAHLKLSLKKIKFTNGKTKNCVFIWFAYWGLSSSGNWHNTSIQLNTRWDELCTNINKFKQSISALTQIPMSLIVIENVKNTTCNDLFGSSNPVELFVYVIQDNSFIRNDQLSAELKETLENHKYIGSFQVICVGV